MKIILFILAFILPIIGNSQLMYQQAKTDLLEGEVMAVAYSGFRENQHPDRGYGAVNPSDAEILEDLLILQDHGLKLIRVYDSGVNSEAVLRIIKKHKLNIKVVLGSWISAEISNHEGCPWLDEPIPNNILQQNKVNNVQEVERTIALANKYKDIVVAINVGNEALVDWTDHLVSVDSMINYVRKVKQSVAQPITVAENYLWWAKKGSRLAKELDFIGIHTYPIWENKGIKDGLKYTVDNIEMVHKAIPDSKVVIFEAGWATTASEFGDIANENNQKIYYEQIKKWGEQTNTTIFFFEAFDEPWKGNPNNPLGAEKHWGLFYVDRTPKLVVDFL